MLDKDLKAKIIAKYKKHENDTGSSEVQIAILSEEIKQLTEHLKIHKKDNSSRRGLVRKVNERRHLLAFLRHEDQKSYLDLVTKLKLRRSAAELKKEKEDALLEEQANAEVEITEQAP
ncbi:MAG: 30S ribosomal protein S15 [Candidatus Magasanikbacteria bacterium GW2011_GWA2_45_39]|uniref:Small ribosomal subunit protein uS15 n=2 Tax=Candidatus Magasanikiibacteriota TaxID=1752731 RepID=A0A0G1N0A6_9BACT|nr:MAG: 30S ribosomal protein S15 [Candidatus Magasanikbacteria bacterium GW2011_GWA2_45_39]KKU13787.1 MAG: 30S ribosomal protein S15 [Candidatus Magasanikbacteria bacterium GW2011_GWC2_45_8]HBW74293.1 30S ribosomal protein S15 [Candidatus Magasanikbacteria bacterium]